MSTNEMIQIIKRFLQDYPTFPINDWYDGRVTNIFNTTVYSRNCFGENREWRNCTAEDIKFIYEQTFQPVCRIENY